MNNLSRIGVAGVLIFGLAAFAEHGQVLAGDTPARSINKQAAVEYLFPEQVAIPAGKASTVVLHFRIAPGLHINSHVPKDDYLIPTALSIPARSGVRLEQAIYPAGTDFVLPIDPKTKLNVYTGEFTIEAHMVATAGGHLVEAKLRRS